jgi:hypothetical protein
MSGPMYHGWRDANGTAHVEVDGRALDPRLDLDNHSPTGFEWGYGGSGPAQLALAMLAHVIGEDAVAHRLHQRFKWQVIAHLDRDTEWWMSSDQIRARAADILAKRYA